MTTNGATKCWGANWSGQLGNGSTELSYRPVQVAGLTSGVTAVAVGGEVSCAIQAGSVKCWGGGFGAAPVVIGGLAGSVTALDISVGFDEPFFCAVDAGAVKCWGGDFGLPVDAAVPVPGVESGATSIAITSSWLSASMCTLIDGAVACWHGEATYDPDDNTIPEFGNPEIVPGASSGATAVTAGESHFCAVIDEGAYCWGLNDSGQLGNGSIDESTDPVMVDGLSTGVTAIAAGAAHACAIVDAGLKCWGANQLGQMGNDSTVDSMTPVDVSGLAVGITAVAAGGDHSCAISGGDAFCWGSNQVGELGIGRGMDSTTPSDVSGVSSGASMIATGGETGDNHLGSSTCVVVSGAAKCWGDNATGQLGDGTFVDRLVPVQVSGLMDGVTDIAIGGRGPENYFNGGHACAVETGAVKCWGLNDTGQLGDGTTIDSSTPVDVAGLLPSATDVAVAADFSCAVVAGAVKCWGGEYGSAPVTVGGLSAGATAVSASSDYVCAIDDGAVKCWKSNNANFADHIASVSPTVVNGLASGVTSVSAGFEHACAVVAGAAKCWGGNTDGELGDGTLMSTSTPVQVQGLSVNVSAVTAGGTDWEYGSSHSCAIVTGAARCWGGNDSGQLGNATTAGSRTPVPVSGLGSDVTSIAAGFGNSCAIADGAAKCWGNGQRGQLGDGYAVVQMPIAVVEPTLVSIVSPAQGVTLSTGHVTLKFFAPDTVTECDVDGGGFAACSSPSDVPGLADGEHVITVRATNGAANTEMAEVEFVVDSSAPVEDLDAPDTKIVSPVAGSIVHGGILDVVFSVTDANATTTTCSIDGGPRSVCGSPWHVSGLLAGYHFLEVTAMDVHGNVASVGVGVDVPALQTVPPVSPPANLPTPKPPALGRLPASFKHTKSLRVPVTCELACRLRLVLKLGSSARRLPDVLVQTTSSSSAKIAFSADVKRRIHSALKHKKRVSLAITPTSTAGDGTSAILKVR